MNEIHLQDIDLNLLVLLDALLKERNVTRAAQKIGVSQSAASHALARLRALLGDPLLIRGKKELLLSTRAEEIKQQLNKALEMLRSSLSSPAPFAPKTSKKKFSIGMGDFAQFVILPLVMKRLAKLAPGLDIWVRELFSGDTDERLATELDMIIVPKFTLKAASSLRTKFLFEERFVCMARKDHPRVKKSITLDDFVSLPHAFITPRGTRGGAVDDALQKLNKERRVALAVPHFLVAPYAVASSDLIITVASRVAEAFSAHLPLKIFEPPIALEPFAMVLVWHERLQRDESHAWLRELIVEAARELQP